MFIVHVISQPPKACSFQMHSEILIWNLHHFPPLTCRQIVFCWSCTLLFDSFSWHYLTCFCFLLGQGWTHGLSGICNMCRETSDSPFYIANKEYYLWFYEDLV